MRRVLCDAITRGSGSLPNRRLPTAPTPKRKNPFQPSGRKGLNQPSRLYKNDFTRTHSSQQNCTNPGSRNTHESRPHKSSYHDAFCHSDARAKRDTRNPLLRLPAETDESRLLISSASAIRREVRSQV